MTDTTTDTPASHDDNAGLADKITLDEKAEEKIARLGLFGPINQLDRALGDLARARALLDNAFATADERIHALVGDSRLTKSDLARICDVSPPAITKALARHDERTTPPAPTDG